jgi:Bacterial Ig-like domain (group 3)
MMAAPTKSPSRLVVRFLPRAYAGGTPTTIHRAYTYKTRKNMKLTFRKAVTGASALALAGGALLATSGTAFAAPAPYFPDAGATLGGIEFVDASGAPITSGSTTTPFSFAVAQNSPTGVTNPKATLYAYTPVLGVPSGAWSGEALSGSTAYPPASPASLHSLANPIVTGVPGDETLAVYQTDFPNSDASTTDGYKGLYELRVKIAGSGGAIAAYAAADVLISGTTWTQVDGGFQLFADTTTTTLTPSPGSPSVPGTNVTLNATVADTTTPATHPAGTVQFFDGATQIGTTQTLSGTGTASVSTNTLAVGTHPLTAVFTSSAPTVVGNSTSAVSNYVIGNLDVSHTALSVNPTTAAAFTPVDLLATVTDTTTPATHPGGTVQFFDGGSPIGSSVPVNATTGVAEIPTYSGFGTGVHHVTAVYSPTGSTIAGSTSAIVDFTATAPTCPGGGTACVDPQTVVATVAAGTITITTPYTPNNPLQLGTLVLNGAGTMLSANAAFGNTLNTGNEIFVTDTQAGNAPWTASVQSSNFVGTTPTNIINGQNAGLTALNVITIPGNNLQAGDVATHDNAAASPAVAAGAAGTQGIGGAAHPFANTVAAPGGTGGDGSVGFTGTFTLNAPTSTVADTYTATVTFTVG